MYVGKEIAHLKVFVLHPSKNLLDACLEGFGHQLHCLGSVVANHRVRELQGLKAARRAAGFSLLREQSEHR